MPLYEILCHPPNLPQQVVRLEAATLEEAMQRADRLWLQQRPSPQLLAIIDQEAQQPIALLYGVS